MITKKLATLLAAGALALGALQAQAATITHTYADADTIGVFIGGGGGSTTGNFDISDPDGTSSFTVNSAYDASQFGGTTFQSTTGFDPDTQDVTSGNANFWFRGTQGDTFSVTLGLDVLAAAAAGGNTVLLAESIGLSVIAALNVDGDINYTVINAGGSAIFFEYAYLGVEIAQNVPDGGATAMLLGLGVLGMAGLRRKLS